MPKGRHRNDVHTRLFYVALVAGCNQSESEPRSYYWAGISCYPPTTLDSSHFRFSHELNHQSAHDCLNRERRTPPSLSFNGPSAWIQSTFPLASTSPIVVNAWIELTTRWRHTEKPSLSNREISSPTNAMALKNLEIAKKNKAGIRSREAKIL
jgi:hypothetical protein